MTGNSGMSKGTIPLELAERLVRMFSFVGDTVLDPFGGTGTTSLAAARSGRNSVTVEVDPHYYQLLTYRLNADLQGFFTGARIVVEESVQA